jgi:hypothetical protein
MNILLIIHACITWYMVGVIWMTQKCQYPLFKSVPTSHLTFFAREQQERIGYVAGPMMLLEAISGFALILILPTSTQFALTLCGAGLIALIWFSTFSVQSPLLKEILEGAGEEEINDLIKTNIFRTVSWTARGLLVLFLLSLAVK